MDRELLQLLALFSVLVFALLPSLFFGELYQAITGRAFEEAKGGVITPVELKFYIESEPNWHGIHGLLLPFWGSETPISFNGSAGDITRHDIRTNITSGYVIISNSSSVPVISMLAPGNVSMLDSITGTGIDSATSTFTTLRSFRFNGTTIANVPSTNMTTVASQEGVYELYLFQDNESFMIAAPIELHMIGFNGEIADYQAMVPQGNQSANLTYYIHLIMNYTAPPEAPEPTVTVVGGAGGGAATTTIVTAEARAVSASRGITFEGPFQLANNTAFRDATTGIWAEPLTNETLENIMNFSRSVKGNFTGTMFIYSGGSVSVFMATIRYSGEKLNNVIFWNRLPPYFTGGSLAVNAPGAEIMRVANNERAFVYTGLAKGDEIILVYRTETASNESVLAHTVFEVYAEPAKEVTQPPACEEGETRCEGNMVVECAGGSWVPVVPCPYGCGAGRCTELAGAPSTIPLLLLFIVWVILVLMLAVGFLICYKLNRRSE